GAMDELTVLCESVSSVDLEDLQQRAELALQAATGLSMLVKVLAPGGVPRSEGKAVRVIDRRGVV
ncbi:MAG TPA: phenylacetate--CoA ligase, partial [Chloroflexota bacterium]|nr:phenylacetate--CoA ligase [Chloroflexota bacterium]